LASGTRESVTADCMGSGRGGEGKRRQEAGRQSSDSSGGRADGFNIFVVELAPGGAGEGQAGAAGSRAGTAGCCCWGSRAISKKPPAESRGQRGSHPVREVSRWASIQARAARPGVLRRSGPPGMTVAGRSGQAPEVGHGRENIREIREGGGRAAAADSGPAHDERDRDAALAGAALAGGDGAAGERAPGRGR